MSAETSVSSGPALVRDPHRNHKLADGLLAEEIQGELERILSSLTFIRSKRLGRFLRFTVEQCLEGRQNSLKEYWVGVEVFNKQESFDPRIDSIVRVEARRLRSKLDQYYETVGREDPIVIQFRKGSYVPRIMTREQHQAIHLEGRTPRPLGKRSIAVSRFSNLGIDPLHEFFCLGITDDVVSALTKVPEFRILARHSGGEPVRADFVLEGSVRKQGDRLRIAAQLIDTTSSVYVWSETYERSLSDAFAVQDEISKAIVASLLAEFEQVPT